MYKIMFYGGMAGTIFMLVITVFIFIKGNVLEDMIKIATNDALKQIEKEINNKLGSQAGALGRLL